MIINFKLHLFIDFFQCNRKAVTVEHRKINIGIIHTDGTAHRTRNGHRIQKVIDFFFQLLPDKSFLFILIQLFIIQLAVFSTLIGKILAGRILLIQDLLLQLRIGGDNQLHIPAQSFTNRLFIQLIGHIDG